MLAYGRTYNEGILNTDYLVTVDVAVAIYISFANNTVDKGDFLMITHSTGVSNVYIDERLLDAAGLSAFSEQYTYIKERYPKPIGELPKPVFFGEKTLYIQVKRNDDIIYRQNEVFEPPTLNAIMKLDLSSQLMRQSFLVQSDSDPKFIVYGDGVTLAASYATTGLFLNGYLFKNYHEDAKTKSCHLYIISFRQLPSNIALMLNITFQKQYEQSKKINYYANNDGKIDIMDTWNVNGKGTFTTQSHEYITVKMLTDLIEA
ncbi:MAG: hypothetical protein EZS28_013552 [Streblomastix strix]|uniref:Uncharacterized protein n=1 Tax=Streblomastix strix TaxID=222440 RepID=A0A5J4W8U7_9EUKA|nr:MAG: hypothetical protein EZS28_013552 [Streblomastix strix]